RLRRLVARHAAEGQTDEFLLEQFIREQSEAAFAVLLERHGPMGLGVCRRTLRDEHLAEDVFQATLLVLAHKAGSIRKKQSLASWLHGVALRLSRKARSEADRGGRWAVDYRTPAVVRNGTSDAGDHAHPSSPADEVSWR